MLVCRVPLHETAGPEWGVDTWKEVDKIHERAVFRSLSWLTERVRNDNEFTSWQVATLAENYARCERCAPTAPAILWRRNEKNKIIAVEDTIGAGRFERALKRRPAPFVTQLKVEDGGMGNVRIGINIASLMHQAVSRLPPAEGRETAAVAWRLDTDYIPRVHLEEPEFNKHLKSNKLDAEHDQPPSFILDLRPEQRRSLTWMVAQESPDVAPFIEEEISEAILEPLGWRVEGRAERAFRVRGGVLADQVGYGKTAITLGLIDCAASSVRKEYKAMKGMPGKIPVKATLIVVPPHLTRQWDNEVRKFTGKTHFTTVVISSASNINSLTIEEIMDADMVIVASNLFKSPVYIQNLAALAAGGNLPDKQEGRYFDARLDLVLAALREQVDRLKDEDGAKLVLEEIRKAAKTGKFS